MLIPLKNVQHLHFVGIGGIGMSGIAEVLHNMGYRVKGSDLALNGNGERLQKLGVDVIIGHHAVNIEGAQVVVVSSAVKADNPEVLAARAQNIPVIQRAEMLAELIRLKRVIAVSGSHGKTTTTSLMACLLDTAGLDPTVVNGGIINAYNTNARRGMGEWAVVEADESDGSFIKLPATIAIVTNIDPEHMDYYKDFATLRAAFLKFIQNTPFYGLAVLCVDHPHVASLIPEITDRRFITYGYSEKAQIRGENLRIAPGGTTFDVVTETEVLRDLFIPLVGKHNTLNALSVVAVGLELGLEIEVIKKAFESFEGVKRRFTKTGTFGGITVIDDYAHHPVEIATVLDAARQASTGKILAVVQPHRFTRLRDLFGDFARSLLTADAVFVAPVYTAGEDPIPGVTSKNLAESIRELGHGSVYEISSPEEIAPLVLKNAQEGDMVLFMGAGNITHWAYNLPKELESLASRQNSSNVISFKAGA
jgi:UDP-N-acetylmuramate--alanine ligase